MPDSDPTTTTDATEKPSGPRSRKGVETRARLLAAAKEIFEQIYDYSIELQQQVPKIDYFATSLPAMLLFENNLARQNQIDANFLRAQALLGLDREQEAKALLCEVLHLDRNHTGAADLKEQLQQGLSSFSGAR